MKFLTCSLLLSWFAIVLEIAFQETVPRGTLFLPIVCAVLLWAPAATAMLTGGLLLLVDWTARPTLLPIVPFVIPFLTAALFSSPDQAGEYRRSRFGLRFPEAFQLPVFVLVALTLEQLSGIPVRDWPSGPLDLMLVLQRIQPLALIAVPVSASLTFLMKLAEETGLRRVTV
jgi:hypothetical protein